MSNSAPITLEQLFRYKRPWGELPHQDAAISELEADIKTAGFQVAMRRDRPWFKTWSQAGRQPAGNLFDHLRPLLDLIAAGEGDYISINRGKAGDTPSGAPDLTRMTIGEVQAKQRTGGWFAVGRYQFIPTTLEIAVHDAGFTATDLFNEENQDWLAVALLLGGKRPILRDYLQGKDVTIETAQLELAKEWASIPQANGRGFYDGDSAGNSATAKVPQVQRALQQSRAALAGRAIPQLRLPAQQEQPAAPAKPAIMEVKRAEPPHLRLTRTKQKDARGLELLRLARMKNSLPMAELLVVSGAPGAQQFRTGAASRAGSLEPLPEGRWGIANIVWAGGQDNYVASWGPGLGPASVPLSYQAPGSTQRSAIEAHYDANQQWSPGTAGCIGFRSVADLKTFISWLRADDPRHLFVDWGLGTCPAVKLR